jgi:hypothetical protein
MSNGGIDCERLEVVLLECGDIALEQEALRLARGRRRVLRRDGAAGQGRPGTLQSAVHRCDAGVEEFPHLARLPAQDLAQDQDSSLPGRQMLQGGHKGEPDRLVSHGDVRWIGLAGDQAVLDRRDPGDLRTRVQVRLDRRTRRAEVHRYRPALASLHHVEADVGGDPEHPGTQRRPALELIEAAPRA